MLRKVSLLRKALLDHKRLLATTIGQCDQQLDHQGDAYRRGFAKSIENPEEFWADISRNIVWTKPWDRVMDNSKPPFTKWFVGGQLSMCYNAVDRHVDEGNGDRTAIIWDSPITNNKSNLTYKDIMEQTSSMAGLLSSLGVERGDRVLIYMPMIPETVVAMLATVRLGAVHSVVFGGFSAKELSTRIRHCQPKVILAANCGVEPSRIISYKPIVDEALQLANAPTTPVVLYQRPGLPKAEIKSDKKDLVWQDEMAKGFTHDCVDIEANEPLYILYTSGTTGDPKGVQHPSGGHAVVNKWSMKALYGINAKDVWWAASDLGWIVGHEYICYSPLLNGSTSVLFEGKPVGTPDAGQFFRVISEHNVKAMFTAPTALRAIHKEDPHLKFGSKYDIKCLQHLFVAGEPCDDETRAWSHDNFKVPIINNWWQTETGHAITCNCIGLGNDENQSKGVAGFPVPGFNLKILRDDGSQAHPEELGRIVAKLPLPPGTMSTLYNADQRFVDTYFQKYKGYYDTMDAGVIDEHGYIKILGRDDDVINVAGHRLSTGALEEAVLQHEHVVDCAVIGIPDELKGQVPLALFIRNKDSDKSGSDICDELRLLVREQIGPVAAFRLSVEVTALPRTRSGKTARKSIAEMAAGRKVKIPPTIDDSSVYKHIKEVLESLNLGTPIQEPFL